MKNFPILKIVLVLFLFGAIISCSQTIYKNSTEMFNSSKTSSIEYNKVCNLQVITFDNDFLSFKEQYQISDINKDVFLNTTNIIMSARKDGEHVAWKWAQENTHIPYEEFTVFYKNLTSFTVERYQKQINFETQKLNIVSEQNRLITTFPNNIYNKWLNIAKLEYKFGYVSDTTSKLFNLK